MINTTKICKIELTIAVKNKRSVKMKCLKRRRKTHEKNKTILKPAPRRNDSGNQSYSDAGQCRIVEKEQRRLVV